MFLTPYTWDKSRENRAPPGPSPDIRSHLALALAALHVEVVNASFSVQLHEVVSQVMMKFRSLKSGNLTGALDKSIWRRSLSRSLPLRERVEGASLRTRLWIRRVLVRSQEGGIRSALLP